MKKKNENLILALCDNELRYTWMFNQAPDFDIDKVIGKRDYEIAKNDSATALLKLKKQVLDSGKPEHATILLPVKNKTRSFHLLAQPIKDVQGDVAGVATCASECVCEKLLSKTKES